MKGKEADYYLNFFLLTLWCLAITILISLSFSEVKTRQKEILQRLDKIETFLYLDQNGMIPYNKKEEKK